MLSNPDLRSLRVAVLLNTSSGGCDASTQRAVLGVLDAAGVRPSRVWSVVGRQVDQALDEASAHSPDVLIVLGGDGTIRAAAQRCEAAGPLLMPLPAGTMNVLAKALYGHRTWLAALTDTLEAPIIQAVHGGEVASHRFYVAGVFGGASLLTEARESIRERDLPAALAQGVTALKQALGHELGYRFEAQAASKAEAVVVLCPLPPPETGLEVLLEAAAIDVDGAGDALRLAVMAAFRGWRADQTVTRAFLKTLEISSSQPIPAILDGERFTLARSERVVRVQDAFFALKPAPAPHGRLTDQSGTRA